MPDKSKKLRETYARDITRRGGVKDARVREAFAAVRREDFCGPPPWFVSGGLFGATGGRGDVESLYDDVLVAIDPARGINNGQPSLHARAIEALALHEGETVLHVGAGAGYYTAILALLVGPAGKVIAYEIETDIAERARANLATYPQVEVRARSGAGPQPAAGSTEVPPRSDESLPKADAIYVNAAASHPLKAWLEALNPGGRLLFPLQAEHSTGAMLLIARPPGESDHWGARMLCGVVFIACKGAQDREAGRLLEVAYRGRGARDVRSLRFGQEARETDWFRGDGWALSTEPAVGVGDEE
ncbi:MAG: methyltransferase [Hyphomicrobiales bacterium]|nr:methyltransferase [Hyphomicrobiales bacterium]